MSTRTILLEAVNNKDILTVKGLIQSNTCDVNLQQDIDGCTPLHIAIQKSYIELVRFILSRSDCDVNKQDCGGDTPLHKAVEQCYLEIVKTILNHNVCDVNIQNQLGNTPLHLAVLYNNSDVLKCILNHNNCCVNTQNGVGATPLHLAVLNSNTTIVRCILTHTSLDVNLKNIIGDAPLDIAILNNNEDIVRCILTEADLGVNIKKRSGDTPLHVAVLLNNVDIVKYLISQRDCVVNIQNGTGDTPLHAAVLYNKIESVKCLITQNGCALNIKNGTGDTPLHLAVLKNNIDIVKCLISQDDGGANIQNQMGNTPLHLAVLYNLIDIVQCLISQDDGAANIQNQRGNTPLHLAVLNNYIDIVKCLISQDDGGANIQNHRGDTPLHLAVLKNNIDIVRCLVVQNDCRYNIENKRGNTPLHLAVLNNNIDIVRCLVNGINITQTERDFKSVYTAVNENKIEILCCLIKDGKYDINMKNEEGYSPFSTTGGLKTLHKIAKCRDVESVRILNEHNVDILTNHVDNHLQLVKYILSENDFQSLWFLIQQNGLYINSLTSFGENIVHLLARFSMDYLCEDLSILLCYELDLNLLNNAGNSPLMVASLLNNLPFIQFLADVHSDVNIQNLKGHSALHLCVIGFTMIKERLNMMKVSSVVTRLCAREYYPKYLECIDILLKLGADVNKQDNNGKTVLMMACMKDDEKLLKTLIRGGADVNIVDSHGRSALQYIDFTNNFDLKILNLLLSHGCGQYLNRPCLNGDTIIENLLKSRSWKVHQIVNIIKFLVYKNVDLQLSTLDERENFKFFSFLSHSSLQYELCQILYLSGGPFVQITQKLCPDNLREQFYLFANNLSLQEICRRVIRQNTGLAIHDRISELLDVKILTDFLRFKDRYSNEFSLPDQLNSFDDDDDDDDDDDYDAYDCQYENDYEDYYLFDLDCKYLNQVHAGLKRASKIRILDQDSDSESDLHAYSDLDSDSN